MTSYEIIVLVLVVVQRCVASQDLNDAVGTACTLSFDQPVYRPMVLGENFTFSFSMNHIIKNRARRLKGDTDYGMALPHSRPTRRRRTCTDLALNQGIQDIITSVRQRSPPVEGCADFFQRGLCDARHKDIRMVANLFCPKACGLCNTFPPGVDFNNETNGEGEGQGEGGSEGEGEEDSDDDVGSDAGGGPVFLVPPAAVPPPPTDGARVLFLQDLASDQLLWTNIEIGITRNGQGPYSNNRGFGFTNIPFTTLTLSNVQDGITTVIKTGSFTWKVPLTPEYSTDCNYTLHLYSVDANGARTHDDPGGCSGLSTFDGFAARSPLADTQPGNECSGESQQHREEALAQFQATNRTCGTTVDGDAILFGGCACSALGDDWHCNTGVSADSPHADDGSMYGTCVQTPFAGSQRASYRQLPCTPSTMANQTGIAGINAAGANVDGNDDLIGYADLIGTVTGDDVDDVAEASIPVGAVKPSRHQRAVRASVGTIGCLVALCIILVIWYRKTKLPFESACAWIERVIGLRCYIVVSPCIPCIRWMRGDGDGKHCCGYGGMCACAAADDFGDALNNNNRDANTANTNRDTGIFRPKRDARGTYTTEDFAEMFERMKQTGDIHADAPTSVNEDRYPREILRDDIRLLSRIGGGAFGDVWKGLIDESMQGGVPAYLVAVKTAKANDTTSSAAAVLAKLALQRERGSSALALEEAEEELLREAVVMAQVGPHENLVSLVGIVTVGDPTMLLVSFCEHGSLLDVLRNQHPTNCNSRRNSLITITNSNNYHGIPNGNDSNNMAAGDTVASSGSHAPSTAQERRTLLLELLKTATSSATTAKATDTEFVAVQKSSLNSGVPKVMQRSNIFSKSEKRRALIEQLLRQTAVEENALQQQQQQQSLNSSTFSSSYTGAYTGPPLFSCADRHRMLLETAKGMAHLTKFFVHRDLAARNVLVDSALTCRIGDFGLSRGLTRRMSLAPTSNSSSRKASSDVDSGMSDHNDGNSAAGDIGDAYRHYGGNQGERRRASRWSQINTDDTRTRRFTPLKSASESCSSIDQAQSWPPNVELSDDLVYYQSEGGVYPIRSTPPEAMMFHRFTPASDVWSWSMLAVEIFTGGMRPFAGVANAALPQRICAGLRPSQPDSCPQATFELLQQCWQAEPSHRPTFDALVKACEDLNRRRTHESADLHPAHSCSNSASTSGQPLLSTLPNKTNSSVSVKTPAGEYEYAIRPKSGASLLSSTPMSSTAGSGRNLEGRATFATRGGASTAEYGIGSTVRGVHAADDAANNDWNRVIGLINNAAPAAAPSSTAIELESVVSYFPIASAQTDIKRGQSGGTSELLLSTGSSSEKRGSKRATTPAPTASRSKQMARSNEQPKKYRSSSTSSAVAIASSPRPTGIGFMPAANTSSSGLQHPLQQNNRKKKAPVPAPPARVTSTAVTTAPHFAEATSRYQTPTPPRPAQQAPTPPRRSSSPTRKLNVPTATTNPFSISTDGLTFA